MCARYYTDAIPPPLQSRMGGGPYFPSKTSDSHLVLEECGGSGGVWMRRIIVAETNVGVDQGRQLYCLIHPAVWRRERWPGRAVVVVPGWSWGLECFCFSFSQIILALFSTAAFSCYTRNQELWLPWDGPKKPTKNMNILWLVQKYLLKMFFYDNHQVSREKEEQH